MKKTEAARWAPVAVGVLMLAALSGPAQAAPQQRAHQSTLEVKLLGLPPIVMEQKAGSTITLNDDDSLVIDASVFEYKGTLVPDFRDIIFTFAGGGTKLDTRILKSVQVSLKNQRGTLSPSGFERIQNLFEYGGGMRLDGGFKLKFKPYIRRVDAATTENGAITGEIVTTTPSDLTIPASQFGAAGGHPFTTLVARDIMTVWAGGLDWRTGVATTIYGSVTWTAPSLQEPISEDYRERFVTTFIDIIGSPMSWPDGTRDGHVQVKVATPVHIHHREKRDDFSKARFYTIPASATLDIFLFPADVAMSFAPEPSRGLPSLAGAAGLAVLGFVRHRQKSASRKSS
jgi:hypothetical protein